MRWVEIEDIAESLEEKYPNVDVTTIKFTTLYDYVITLEDFKDSKDRCNEKILEAIQSAWIELREEE